MELPAWTPGRVSVSDACDSAEPVAERTKAAPPPAAAAVASNAPASKPADWNATARAG